MANLTQFETSPEKSAPPVGTNVGPNGGNGHHAGANEPNGSAYAQAAVHLVSKPATVQATPAQEAGMPAGLHDNPHGAGLAAVPTAGQGAGEDTYVFPASREQTRYWMLAQLDPESTASNMAIAFELEGQVRDELVEQAIAALTLRHEALRTIFRLEAGVLSQVVLARPLYRFTVEDLTSTPQDAQPAALEATVSRHGHTVIDLENGPVLHAHLVHLDQRRHVMALTMNHIVCDGWSNGLLIRDFTVLYEALVAGEEPELPELPFQFADFSLWQNEYLTSPAADEAAAFWKSHITNDLMALDMPTDHPRPAGRSFPGHIESALLPKAIDEQLKAYCRKTGSTKHIVLLAAFEALCARYTGQNEFLLGSTIANRTQPGMEDVVGRFANPQIIVAKAGGDPSFAALEQRVRDWEMAAYTHQDLPFSRIIEDFQIDQAGATSQFLQVWFLYQKAFMQPQAGRTLRVTPRRSVSGGVDFDLLVSVVERAEGPRIQFEYNTLIFEPARIGGLIAGLIELLGGALNQPDLPLSQIAHVAPSGVSSRTHSGLSLQAAAEAAVGGYSNRSQRREKNGTPIASQGAVSSPHSAALTDHGELPQTLPAVVATHAVARPRELAASAGSTLTWQRLEQQSRLLAAELRRTSPDLQTVVVPVAHCPESLVAVLAALRLGSRIVPLPGHADSALIDRLAQQPQTVLLAARSSGISPTVAFEDFAALAVDTVPLDATAPDRAQAQFRFLTDAASLAFTEVSAAVLTQKAADLLQLLGLDTGSSVLCFPAATPLDATLQLLLPLAAGAELHFAADLATHPMAAQVAANDITCVMATPEQARTILASGWAGDRRVSLAVAGGRLPASLKQTFENDANAAPLRLRSATYLCTVARAGIVAGIESLTGYGLLPVGGSTLSLRNADGLQLPAGAFGEVCVTQPGSDAVVRTGLMARSSTTGVIELQDEVSRYLQLRGHRVCLGDIEDAALELPAVHAAAAVSTGDALLLYVTGAPDAVPGASDTHRRGTAALERHLSQTLPSHLVPSDVVWVTALPRTADGRLDVARLPRPEAVEMVQVTDFNALPLNKVEEKLAAIWKDVLGLRSVDAHKSFFALGGSSLLLVRLFARINKAFDTSLPITTIFDAQTIAALAQMLGGQSEMSHLVQVQTAGTKPPLFMIHSYLLYQGLSNSLGPDQPFFGLRELEQDGHLTIDERVEHYTREIRRVQPHGPYHVAGWCAAGPLTVEVARKLITAGEEVRYLALFDSWLPGYLESIETANPDGSWRPYRSVGSKINYHRNRVRGLGFSKKAQYLWLAVTRIARDTRYRIYLRNWERLHRLSEKYHFQLPQFMHNTSLETFSALKEYQGRKLPAHLTLIRASDSREVVGAAPSCGWEQVAENGVEVLWAPGDHETMFIGKNLKVTSEIVQLGLETAAAYAQTLAAAGETANGNSVRGVMHVDCPST